MVILPMPELVASDVPDKILVAALAVVFDEILPVNFILVGAIVVLGRTMPLGPKVMVVPSTTAVVC